jgi:hypothetical protein
VVPTNAKFAGKGKPSKLVLVEGMVVVVAVFAGPPDAVTITVSVTVIVSLSKMSGNVGVSVTVIVSLSITTAGDGPVEELLVIEKLAGVVTPAAVAVTV